MNDIYEVIAALQYLVVLVLNRKKYKKFFVWVGKGYFFLGTIYAVGVLVLSPLKIINLSRAYQNLQ